MIQLDFFFLNNKSSVKAGMFEMTTFVAYQTWHLLKILQNLIWAGI